MTIVPRLRSPGLRQKGKGLRAPQFMGDLESGVYFQLKDPRSLYCDLAAPGTVRPARRKRET